MSIFATLFGNGSTPPATPAPGAQGTPQNNTPGTQANGAIPPNTDSTKNDPTPVPGSSAQTSPLDKHSEIWKTVDTPGTDPNQSMFAGLDPAKVMESAKKVDFSKAVSTEHIEAIQKGGQEAVTAFAQAMNSVAQTVYAQNAIATTKIVEQALGKAREQYDASIPGLVKKLSASEQLLETNPLLSNPAVQPLVGALTEQLTRKNPNASAKEIQQQVTDYFAALGTSFAPKPVEDKSKSGIKANQTDWSTFLE